MMDDACPLWVEIVFAVYMYYLIWLGTIVWITRYPATLPRAHALPKARALSAEEQYRRSWERHRDRHERTDWASRSW